MYPYVISVGTDFVTLSPVPQEECCVSSKSVVEIRHILLRITSPSRHTRNYKLTYASYIGSSQQRRSTDRVELRYLQGFVFGRVTSWNIDANPTIQIFLWLPLLYQGNAGMIASCTSRIQLFRSLSVHRVCSHFMPFAANKII
jgi:hypothetical protein